MIRHSAIETHLHGGPGLPLEAPKDLKLEPAPESPRAEGGEEPAAGD